MPALSALPLAADAAFSCVALMHLPVVTFALIRFCGAGIVLPEHTQGKNRWLRWVRSVVMAGGAVFAVSQSIVVNTVGLVFGVLSALT